MQCIDDKEVAGVCVCVTGMVRFVCEGTDQSTVAACKRPRGVLTVN